MISTQTKIRLGLATLILPCFAAVGCSNNSGVSNTSAGSNVAAVGLSATGASLKCTSSGQNAFTTYGAAAFLAVNAQIFANVSTEISNHGTTNLGTAFTLIGTNTPTSTQDNALTFEANLAAFLVYLYGGPSFINYNTGTAGSPVLFTVTGPQSMQQAHAGLAITAAQYTYFVDSIVVPALTTAGVPSSDISSCFAPPLLDSTFIASIVGQ